MDELAALQARAADLHVLGDHAAHRRHRADVAQQLLDRGREERRIVAQQRHLLGMAEQGEQAVGDQVGGGLVPGLEQDGAGGEQFLLAQKVARLVGSRQRGEQVVARGGAPLGQQLPEAVVDGEGRRLHPQRVAVAQMAVAVEVGAQRLRVVPEQAVGVGAGRRRHAEQFRDHPHRQRVGQLADHLQPA